MEISVSSSATISDGADAALDCFARRLRWTATRPAVRVVRLRAKIRRREVLQVLGVTLRLFFVGGLHQPFGLTGTSRDTSRYGNTCSATRLNTGAATMPPSCRSNRRIERNENRNRRIIDRRESSEGRN